MGERGSTAAVRDWWRTAPWWRKVFDVVVFTVGGAAFLVMFGAALMGGLPR